MTLEREHREPTTEAGRELLDFALETVQDVSLPGYDFAGLMTAILAIEAQASDARVAALRLPSAAPAPASADLNALEQAARGIRDGTLVYDYPTFQLLIAAVRGADALRAAPIDVDRLRAAMLEVVVNGALDCLGTGHAPDIAAEYAALSATEPAARDLSRTPEGMDR